MFQQIVLDWSTFGFVLADCFFFGVCYALFVRWLWIKKVEDQTALLVVFGVGVVLVLSIAFFGLYLVALLFALFAAAGLPMVVEYVERIHRSRTLDAETARRLEKEVIRADASTDR